MEQQRQTEWLRRGFAGLAIPFTIRNLDNNFQINKYFIPNPVDDVLHLDIDALEQANVTLSISNIMGQVISRQQVMLQQGSQTRTLETASLPAGIYVLSLTTEKGTVQKKFIKR